jgi:ABC-type nitrate/sulfonate/bicarbonate transport system ATPase subunit
MSGHDSPLVEFDRVDLSRGGRVIVEDFSMRIEAGEVVALVGPSGRGKTTVLHAAAGLVAPSAGTVTRRVERQGVLFQEPRLLPWMSVQRNVLLGAPGRGVWSRSSNPDVERLLASVGLEGTAASPPFRLSGGMQRRVALARALFGEPVIVFADEPFAHLDPGSARLVAEALSRTADSGVAVLLTAHDTGDPFPLMGNYRTLIL